MHLEPFSHDIMGVAGIINTYCHFIALESVLLSFIIWGYVCNEKEHLCILQQNSFKSKPQTDVNLNDRAMYVALLKSQIAKHFAS